MATRDIVVIGASAGGVEALRTVLGGLSADLPATVLTVLHTPPSEVNALAAILKRSTALTVTPADGEVPLRRGTVIVARPDHHLVVHEDRAVVTRGPRENGHRPAVDVLFRSAARALGPRVIAVVLSGALDDGSAGLVAVRSRRGLGVVQDPAEALHTGMPSNAIAAAGADHVVPLAAMPSLLSALVGTAVATNGGPTSAAGAGATSPSAGAATDDELLRTEVAFAEMRANALRPGAHPGEPTGLSCPECHGPLFAIRDGRYLRYRCRVGHAWSSESLLARNDAALEAALWLALRSLQEKAELSDQLAARSAQSGQRISQRRFADQAAEASEAAERLRRMLVEGVTGTVQGGEMPGYGSS